MAKGKKSSRKKSKRPPSTMESKDQPSNSSNAKRPLASPLEDQPEIKREDKPGSPQLSMERFRAQKAESLQKPVDIPTSIDLKDAGVLHEKSDAFHVQSTSPSDKTAPSSSTPPLANDAIADILRKTKPDCPRAQAWIQAHEIAKAAQERMNNRIDGPDEPRKKVALRLRDRPRPAATVSGASNREINAPHEEIQCGNENAGEGKANEEKTMSAEVQSPEAIFESLCLAQDKLEKTIAELQEWRKTL